MLGCNLCSRGEVISDVKKQYTRPALVEYGSLEQLTRGPGGNIPDNPPGNAVGPSCTQAFPQQVDCHVRS